MGFTHSPLETRSLLQPGQYFCLEMIIGFVVFVLQLWLCILGVGRRSQPFQLSSNLPNSCRKHFHRTSAKGNLWEFSGLGLEGAALTVARALQMDMQAPWNGGGGFPSTASSHRRFFTWKSSPSHSAKQPRMIGRALPCPPADQGGALWVPSVGGHHPSAQTWLLLQSEPYAFGR